MEPEPQEVNLPIFFYAAAGMILGGVLSIAISLSVATRLLSQILERMPK